MLPNKDAPIKQPTGLLGESYVLDMHSRTGFSGSPVFMYRTFGANLGTQWEEFSSFEFDIESRGHGKMLLPTLFRFIGIHWGQFPEAWELRKRDDIDEVRRSSLITDGAYVEGMSGMTCVIPAWKVMEVLITPRDSNAVTIAALHPVGVLPIPSTCCPPSAKTSSGGSRLRAGQ
jgi:hypothetical protein